MDARMERIAKIATELAHDELKAVRKKTARLRALRLAHQPAG
jgi:hypothetical protein